MWRSSLEKLRSWINRKKRRYLDDAVASAIRAVDENSCGVDGMLLTSIKNFNRSQRTYPSLDLSVNHESNLVAQKCISAAFCFLPHCLSTLLTMLLV